MPKILYAREHPLDLPRKLMTEDILIAHTSSQAKAIIDSRGDSLGGYILGMVMIKEGVDVQEFNSIYEQRLKMASKIEEERSKYNSKENIDLNNLISKRIALKEIYNLNLDFYAGKKVFDYIKQKGFFGKKPILWFTSQHGVNKNVGPDEKNFVSLANVPVESNLIYDWFDGLDASQ